MRRPTAKAVPGGDQNAVGSELLWRTVRGDGGLALPIFVRTPQPKVRCPRSARAMRRASASSGRCGFHCRCERPWHSRHGMFDSARPHRASPLRGWRLCASPNRLQALTYPSGSALRAACGSLSHSVRLAGFPGYEPAGLRLARTRVSMSRKPMDKFSFPSKFRFILSAPWTATAPRRRAHNQMTAE